MHDVFIDYTALFEKSKKIKLLKSCAMLLDWDQETYMPSKGLELRSMQKAFIESLAHREFISNETEDLIARLIDLEHGHLFDEKALDNDQKLNVKLWRDDLIKAKKLPDAFVKEFAELTSESVAVWAKAKETNDFHLFSPYLEKVIAFVRKKAHLMGFKDHPYDALIDDYELGMTTKELDKLFELLKKELIPLAKTLYSIKHPDDFLYGDFEESSIFKFDHYLLEKMGFEEGSYRLDASSHPFCMGLYPSDIRMTTVMKTSDLFAANISSTIHEAGHGLYEQGLQKKHFGSPLGEYVSMGIHESQSKFWECFIGQSLPFWTYFYPKLQELFANNFSSHSLNEFYKAINQVSPSMIRIYADEVTYCLHVILRYEIEKGLLSGSIEVNDLPRIWNEKMEAYIGVVPKSFKEGLLQDIHWAWGLFGYFPTYALGNLYAAQLFDALKTDCPDWQKKIAHGDLIFIKEWLKEKIHRHGRAYKPKELIQLATGKELSENYFIEYLKNKYPV